MCNYIRTTVNQIVPLCYRFRSTLLLTFTFQVTLLDMVVYIVLKNTGYSKYAIRWSRVLRPAFIINFSESRQVGISIDVEHLWNDVEHLFEVGQSCNP